MTSQQDKNALQKVVKEREIDATQLVQEMRATLVYSINWEALLQAAPTAIYCTGACIITSSSEKAVIDLPTPVGGFKHLQWPGLKANLVESVNMGMDAFNTAQKSMADIDMKSQEIYKRINQVLGCLINPGEDMNLMKIYLSQIKTISAGCLRDSQDMETKFHNWLMYCGEMHAACVQKETDTDSQIQKDTVDLLVKQSNLENYKKQEEEVKKTVDTLSTQVKDQEELFKKAADKIPSSWDLLGQEVIRDLTKTVTQSLGGISRILSFGLDSSQKSSGSGKPPPPPTPNNKPLDPAYSEVHNNDVCVNYLKAILSGKDGKSGIDWDALAADEQDQTSKNKPIRYIAGTFSSAAERFSKIATKDEPSKILITALQTFKDISQGIQDVVDKNAKSPNPNWPGKDSQEVKKWQTDFQPQYEAIANLTAKAQTAPGMPGNAVPNVDQTDSKMPDNQTDTQTMLHTLGSALTTTQEALVATQKNYVETTKMLIEQQKAVAALSAEVTQLATSTATLKEIKKTLITCMRFIVKLKENINSLVQFFDAMDTMVNNVVETNVEGFLGVLGSAVGNNTKIGAVTLSSFMKQQVYVAAITLRVYFSIFGDVAKMWATLSTNHIQPGMNLCNELSIPGTSPQDMETKMGQLNKWSKDASEEVSKIAREKQQAMQDGMQQRVEQVQKTTQLISGPTDSVRKAIKNGTTDGAQDVQNQLEQRKKQDPLNEKRLIPVDEGVYF
ncbi:hypothetical protein GQ53DRAFT_801702 [Thozetella sp. PMI_491]|nr:hypothetical protein GQ53DRAFT_801702 [Thozetella sp. PMI_491]